MRLILLTIAALLVPARAHAAADSPQPAPTLYATAEYRDTTVEGWTVRLSPALQQDKALKTAGLKEIARQLGDVARLLPAGAVEKLKTVPIWVDTDGSDRSQYHPDKGWLQTNHYNPDK